jgi:sugar/nucleoside kinase (ribokinase family)
MHAGSALAGDVQLASALAGVDVYLLPSDVSTTFTNVYRDGRRVQVIESVAEGLWPADLPPAWLDAPIVLLGPVAGEVPAGWASAFPEASLVGMGAQGCMRAWDSAGHVYPTRWAEAADYLQHVSVLFLSREDVGGDEDYLKHLTGMARLSVVTDGWHGSTIYQAGTVQQVAPRSAREVDPTGAGDVFATAFLIRLAETEDPYAAARFANVTASFSVEGVGAESIPDRATVENWLAAHG